MFTLPGQFFFLNERNLLLYACQLCLTSKRNHTSLTNVGLTLEAT